MSDPGSNVLPNALLILCQRDGRIATADEEAARLLGDAKMSAPIISDFAAKAHCGELTTIFELFAAGQQSSAKTVAVCGASDCEITLRWLNGVQSPLIAVELVPLPKTAREQQALLEVGRATNRLLHDFKNQMSGLKLYAAYLKKRFAGREDLTEGLEIADKIVQSLNEMTENAALIGKLTRPVDVKMSDADLPALVQQVVQNLLPQSAARGVEIVLNSAPLRLPLDLQQMTLALKSLLAQAVDASPAGGTVTVTLQASGNQTLLSISDAGDTLSEQQRQSFFDFLTNERLNRSSLGLALARRILEAHGGTAEVLATPAGKTISIKFGTEH
ncbi:MAG TPA: ATP-binding protein [Blastocatellia bacterium]|nr:ATP-binding protein [Blastocatellia bacterium]HMV85570.1 ATP-binding protein [Blastocatellia bacterium]HMY76392.1 ATP-binding protein [Blastocatellia bacterium]HMZ21946.1 ATP-binding protein [Blastocatellia bacterium]HNG30548.1 ATP-binding protein [Blastocatellia bacterium]